eukprot:1911774-Amphidinium_carterae.1
MELTSTTVTVWFRPLSHKTSMVKTSTPNGMVYHIYQRNPQSYKPPSTHAQTIVVNGKATIDGAGVHRCHSQQADKPRTTPRRQCFDHQLLSQQRMSASLRMHNVSSHTSINM